MPYYRPRAMAKIRVPVMGTTSERIKQAEERTVVEFYCPVMKVHITQNDFNTADEATLEVSYDQIGVDPRLLSNAIIYIYIGNAESAATWQPLPDDLRFVGIVNSASRVLDDQHKTVSIKALDYTTLFIAMKPYPQSSGLPKFTMTLNQAWQIICDHTGFYNFSESGDGSITSSVSDLRGQLRGVPDDSVLDTVLGGAVLSRIAKFAVLQVPHEADAWAVWRACTDSLGLLTWISLDECFVAQAPDYYSAKNPAVFVYGSNIKSISEDRDVSTLNGKGVHLTHFDAVSGKTLESFFPLRNDSRVVKKRLTATKKPGAPGLAPVTDYEHQTYPYPATQDTLDDVAQRVWEERSRQELEGRLTTAEMYVKAKDGTPVDVLGIRHGDQIIVQLDDIALDEMRKLPTVFARSYYLLQRGFPAATASLIARDQGYLDNLLATFVVKETVIDFDSQAESFQVEVAYCSRINPNSGSADETTT